MAEQDKEYERLDKAAAVRRAASDRRGYRNTLAIAWVKKNHPRVWAKIRVAAAKKYPLKRGLRRMADIAAGVSKL